MNFRILHWVDYFVSDIMTEIIRFPNSKNLLSPELQGSAGQLPAVHRQHFQTVISFRYNCSIHHRLCFNGFANQFFSVSQKKNLTQFFRRNCDNFNEKKATSITSRWNFTVPGFINILLDLKQTKNRVTLLNYSVYFWGDFPAIWFLSNIRVK